MVFNLWRQLRLAGIVAMCIGSWMPDVRLMLLGSVVLLIGVIYGLTSVERKLELLGKENSDEKSEERDSD